MGTFLFDSIVFGPVKSRRLGISLGVNLLPTNSKVCSFDCIYCECGWTNSVSSGKLPSRESIRESLEEKLEEMLEDGEDLDVITFAGNGEPTLHPDFAGIINDTIEVRNHFFPDAQIAVLSNSTYLHKPDVVKALLKVDQNILKLDSGIDATFRILNQPKTKVTIEQIVENLKQFKGNLILQTLFLRGTYKGVAVDNTRPEEISLWLELLNEINPKEVMVYTIARETPAENLERISVDELRQIAHRVEALGIPVQVTG